jgi:hypothetical protein
MKADNHEKVRQIIDKMLIEGSSLPEEQSLRRHLDECAECAKYLDASTRVITGLSGYSFDVDRALQAQIHASVDLRAQQLEATQPSRARTLGNYALALVLTVAGSSIAAQLCGAAAAFLRMPMADVQRGFLALWVVPSLCFLLLIPALPSILAAWTNRKGQTI